MSTTFNMPCVKKLVENQVQPVLQSVPVASKEFYLSPWNFDFSEKAKYGEKGRFPTNLQYRAHFHSFLKHGYEASREPIDVRFLEHADTIAPFSVQFVDGQNKLLIMLSILALVEKCDPWIKDVIIVSVTFHSFIHIFFLKPSIFPRTSKKLRLRKTAISPWCWQASVSSGATSRSMPVQSNTSMKHWVHDPDSMFLHVFRYVNGVTSKLLILSIDDTNLLSKPTELTLGNSQAWQTGGQKSKSHPAWTTFSLFVKLLASSMRMRRIWACGMQCGWLWANTTSLWARTWVENTGHMFFSNSGMELLNVPST